MATERLKLTQLGWSLAIPVMVLALIGLTSIHATDRDLAAPSTHIEQTLDPLVQTPPAETNWVGDVVTAIGPRTIRQLLFFITGLGLFMIAIVPSYQRIGRYAWVIYWLVIGVLVLLVLDKYVDVPLVPVVRNTRRWVGFGALRLQPSEFMKIALVLALAHYLRHRTSYRTWWGLVPPFLMTLLPMILILKQPDLGTLLMLLPVLFAMLFAAGARLRHLATIVLLGLATLPMFYFAGMKDYQRKRIQVVFKQNYDDPAWHRKEGYQLRQSKIALAYGDWVGVGYGGNLFVQRGLLPEEHNDFIFAIIGNQWGWAGGLLVLICYLMIVIVGLEVALVTNDPFGRLLAVGVVSMIAVQALLNICMTIGLAPITGMPLPFVSAGGSSLWANFIGLGLLINVAKRRPLLIAHAPFEHGDD